MMNWKRLTIGLICGALFSWNAHAGELSTDAGGVAPAFSIVADAGQIDIEDFKGSVVLVDFWASWCVPCRQSFKWLNELHARYADQGLVILGVNLDEERNAAQRFLQKYPAAFRIGYDPEGNVAEAYQVAVMPSSYLIDQQGRIRLAHTGFRERDTAPLEAAITALLNEGNISSASVVINQ